MYIPRHKARIPDVIKDHIAIHTIIDLNLQQLYSLVPYSGL